MSCFAEITKITKFAVRPLSILNCFASPVLKTFVEITVLSSVRQEIPKSTLFFCTYYLLNVDCSVIYYMAILFFPNPTL